MGTSLSNDLHCIFTIATLRSFACTVWATNWPNLCELFNVSGGRHHLCDLCKGLWLPHANEVQPFRPPGGVQGHLWDGSLTFKPVREMLQYHRWQTSFVPWKGLWLPMPMSYSLLGPPGGVQCHLWDGNVTFERVFMQGHAKELHWSHKSVLSRVVTK